MASAMVEGLLAQKAAVPADLACFTPSGRTAALLAKKTGIAQADSLPGLLGRADIVVVAFKPQHLAAAENQLGELTAGRLVISVLAGKTLARLARVFPRARNVVRCMPNTPSKIGAGVTGWCAARSLTAEDRAAVTTLLGALGTALEIAEGSMNALTAVSGCGPAYVFEFAGALREAGVAAGLDPATAETLAIETLLGASRLLAQRQASPEHLRDAVTSPHGATFAGLQRLAAGNFRGLIKEVVAAAQARAQELSGD
jgi:pyrroline-5-carboxylate reductase